MTGSVLEPTPATWKLATHLDDLWQGEMVSVSLGAIELLLVRLEGEEIHAYNNRCPHAGSRLSEGRLQLPILQCPTHLWEFDVHTGEGINPRTCHLKRYAVKVVGDAVFVLL